MTNKKWIFALLLIVLSFSFMLCSCFAQFSVGVSVGDKFIYDCLLQGSHDKNDYWAVWNPDWNQSKWTVTVTNIVDSRVTFSLQILLSNSTMQSFPSQYIDLFSGGSNDQNYMFFVYSNLTSSQPLYISDSKYIINSTITRTFASGQREINHINFSSTIDYWDVYMDKKTGVLVVLLETYLDNQGTFTLELTESSLWSITNQPTTLPTAIPTIQSSITPSHTSTNTTPSPTIPEFSNLTILLSIVVMISIGIFLLSRKHPYNNGDVSLK